MCDLSVTILIYRLEDRTIITKLITENNKLFVLIIVFLILQMRKCKPESEFLCNSGQCIEKIRVCNEYANCADGSDENEIMCKVYEHILSQNI